MSAYLSPPSRLQRVVEVGLVVIEQIRQIDVPIEIWGQTRDEWFARSEQESKR